MKRDPAMLCDLDRRKASILEKGHGVSGNTHCVRESSHTHMQRIYDTYATACMCSVNTYRTHMAVPYVLVVWCRLIVQITITAAAEV